MSQKAVNKRSFYGGMESQTGLSGGRPDIEMPPIIEDVVVSQPQHHDVSPFTVPDKLPQDTIDELEASSEQEQDNMELDSTITDDKSSRDDLSQLQEGPVRDETSQTQDAKKSPQSPQASFKAVREAKERAERERDAIMNQMIEMQIRMKASEQQSAKIAPVIQEEPEIDLNIDEDSLVDGRHLKGVSSKIKRLEEKLKQYETNAETLSIEAKIRQQYPDFESVVSVENVQKLNTEYPDIAIMLGNTKDVYSQASAAYSVMKKFGIHKNVYSEDKAKALANSVKPRPLASVNPQQGDSPLSKANAFANGLTPELKEQMRQEMNAARKGY